MRPGVQVVASAWGCVPELGRADFLRSNGGPRAVMLEDNYTMTDPVNAMLTTKYYQHVVSA